MRKANTEVLIAGGGFVGASLALASVKMGFDTLLVDASDKKAGGVVDPRASMLSMASLDLLERLGVLDGKDHRLQPIWEMVISHGFRGENLLGGDSRSGRTSPFFLNFTGDEKTSSEDWQKPLAWMIENRHLQATLEKALRKTMVPRLAPVRVTTCRAIERNQIRAKLDNGEQIVAQLCIAADGANSHLREEAGIETTGWHYKHQVLTGVVYHEWEHDGIAREHFLPSGPFALLPLPGRRSSLVWVESPQTAKALTNCSEEVFLSQARRCMGKGLGGLSLEGKRLTYPLRLQLARKYGTEGLVLVGDAAHVVHPLAGQGLNMGLRDVLALESLLRETQRLGLTINSRLLLERYQHKRYFDNLLMGMVTDGTHRLFQGDCPVLSVLRDVSLGTTQASPWIRNLGKRLVDA